MDTWYAPFNPAEADAQVLINSSASVPPPTFVDGDVTSQDEWSAMTYPLSDELAARIGLVNPSTLFPGISYRSTESGSAGVNWLFGDGPPSIETGSVDNFYLETVNGNVYHKTRTGWGTTIGCMKGPRGIQGAQGTQGIQGDTGAATGTEMFRMLVY
jgi:hypothetical protein